MLRKRVELNITMNDKTSENVITLIVMAGWTWCKFDCGIMIWRTERRRKGVFVLLISHSVYYQIMFIFYIVKS